jgi:hypothetical protein
MTVAGGFTGQRDATVQAQNLTLINLTSSQHFYVQYLNNLVGGLNQQNAETLSFGPPTSDLYGGQFTINDKVAGSDLNFMEYRKTFSSSYDTQDVTLKLYKPGGGNSELALRASFIIRPLCRLAQDGSALINMAPMGWGRRRDCSRARPARAAIAASSMGPVDNIRPTSSTT